MSPIDFEQEADSAQGPTNEQLSQVASLANYQRELEQEVEYLEGELKKAKDRLRKVREVDLPDMLVNQCGLQGMTLADGKEVAIEEKMYCSVPKKNLDWVCNWLSENGHGALVKRDITLPFNKGEEEQVQKVTEVLTDAGFDRYTIQQAVHTGQLKTLIKELQEQGAEGPTEKMGAYTQRQTVVK